ncbi:hypothetical protein EMCRGX_G029331 [Ephydatia muelleri]
MAVIARSNSFALTPHSQASIKSIICDSDIATHDTNCVGTKLWIFALSGKKPQKIYCTSDGCAAQYKNCKDFTHLCHHLEDFGATAEWNVCATSHGKSAGDGAGAINVPVSNHPNDPLAGVRTVPLDRVIYVERSDFMEHPVTSYYRLTPDQPVGLNHASIVISVENIVKDTSGSILELHVKCHRLSDVPKPKAFIHWVSNPRTCTVRLYSKLFLHKDPDDLVDGFISDMNPSSLEVIEGALVERTFQNAHVGTVVQFERLGYFCVDRDTKRHLDNLVFNRTVSLREDSNNPVPV